MHKELGPGLLESTYEKCLAHELTLRKVNFELQHPLPVKYKGIYLDCDYRLDLVVENQVILELKSVSKILEIHKAQLLTYMKLLKINRQKLHELHALHGEINYGYSKEIRNTFGRFAI